MDKSENTLVNKNEVTWVITQRNNEVSIYF